MKEYKIIKHPTSRKDSYTKFEDDVNNHARQGWRVINVYCPLGGYPEAILERDKNR